MGPDRNNYEIWLIDYLDGNLDRETTDLLLAFLEQNPDVKEECADLSSSRVLPPEAHFRNSKGLKKSSSEMSQQQFELLCVAAAENDLEDDPKAELDEIISSDPEKQFAFALLSRIRLTPPDHKFRYKYKLRKLTFSQKAFRYSLALVSSAAAVVAIIIALVKPATEIPDIKTTALKSVSPFSSEAAVSNVKIIEKTSPHISQATNGAFSLNRPPAARKKGAIIDNPAFLASSEDYLVPVAERYKINKIAIIKESLMRSVGDINLAVISITPVNSIYDSEGSGPGKLVEKVLRDKVIRPGSDAKGPVKVFDIADAGIRGLRKLFGWNMSLKKNTDEKGDVRSVSFNSKLISFNAPVKKSTRLP